VYFNPIYNRYKYEWMQPHQLRGALKDMPLALVTLGTLEWHGHHNPLGLDCLKAHGLMLETARKLGGGVVLPPNYDLGLHGASMEYGADYFGSIKTSYNTAMSVANDYLANLERVGFKAVILYGGHAPSGRVAKVARDNYKTRMAVWAGGEVDLAATDYTIDHAGVMETSMMMAVAPDSVDMSRAEETNQDRLYDDLLEGCGQDAREATLAKGQAWVNAISDELAQLGRDLLKQQAGAPTRVKYVGAVG